MQGRNASPKEPLLTSTIDEACGIVDHGSFEEDETEEVSPHTQDAHNDSGPPDEDD